MSKRIRGMFLWAGCVFLGLSPQLEAQTPADTALFRIIRSGDASKLQQRLGAGADANANYRGVAALMAATLCGSVEEMRVLLDDGARPNAADEDSITALWLAVPDTARTSLLLRYGANPALLSKEHYNLLVKLVNFAGTTALYRQLVAHGADPNGGEGSHDNLLLYTAVGTDDTVLVDYLLHLGMRPNDTTSFGDYPINSALGFRCFATMKQLVEHGANVNVGLPRSVFPSQRGMTPLMLAAVGDDEPSFYYLLDHGADIHAKCETGYTALHFLQLAEADHPGMTRALLARGADPAEKAPDGSSPRSLSSNKGNSSSFQALNQKH